MVKNEIQLPQFTIPDIGTPCTQGRPADTVPGGQLAQRTYSFLAMCGAVSAATAVHNGQRWGVVLSVRAVGHVAFVVYHRNRSMISMKRHSQLSGTNIHP